MGLKMMQEECQQRGKIQDLLILGFSLFQKRNEALIIHYLHFVTLILNLKVVVNKEL